MKIIQRHTGRVLLVTIIVMLSPAVRATHLFTEDFTTHTYCDDAMTTAKWEAGELKLYPFTPSELDVFGTTSGLRQLARSGDLLLLPQGGAGLRLVDAQHPDDLQGGAIFDTPGSCLSVAVSGDLAYVADGDGGLRIVNIAPPGPPFEVGYCENVTYAQDVAVCDDRAFVVGDDQLWVVDIGLPDAPSVEGTLPLTGASSIVLAGRYAYINANGLRIVDVHDPLHLTVEGEDSNGFYQMAIRGEYAFLAASGMLVLDISDPTIITQVAQTPSVSYHALAISGNYAYLADWFNDDVHVFDISNPTDPDRIQAVSNTLGNAFFGVVAGTDLFLGEDTLGLRSMKVAQDLRPLQVGECTMSGQPYKVAIAGGYALVADRSNYLRVVDISNPTAPSIVEICQMTSDITDVAVYGDHAFVADREAYLYSVDISDPTDVDIDHALDIDSGYSVRLHGQHAYVGSGNLGVVIFDISNPEQMGFAGTIDTDDFARETAFYGNYAYIADRYAGLAVADITNPDAPDHLRNVDTDGAALSVVVEGPYAYVADGGESGLVVFSLADPAQPAEVAHIPLPGSSTQVVVDGDRAYVSNRSLGLYVVDVTNPLAPALVDSLEMTGDAFGLAVDGDNAFVCTKYEGLKVAKVRERNLDIERNLARSTVVATADPGIAAVRLACTATDSFHWEASTSGGAAWTAVPPGDEWTALPPGNDLLWRAELGLAPAPGNPTCDQVELEWLPACAEIDSVTDIPGDQGGQVRIHLTRSGLDLAAQAELPVASYNVWREVTDPALLGLIAGADREVALASVPGMRLVELDDRYYRLPDAAKSSGGMPAGTWEVLHSFAATQQQIYLTPAATVVDSSAAGDGMIAYCITAHTTTPSVWYASAPASGYSVDNMAPETVGDLVVNYSADGNELLWSENPEDDVDHYLIYRGQTGGAAKSGDCGPMPEEPLVAVTGTSWIDDLGGSGGDAWSYCYYLTAVDHAGNESEPTVPEETQTSGLDTGTPAPVFVLHPNVPNPFNPRTEIAYELDRPARVSLAVYDVGGRLVAELVAGERQDAGAHRAIWSGRDIGGREVAAGVYLCRLRTERRTAVRRMTLVK